MGQGSELHCIASCIYKFFNKYNWLYFFRWAIVRQRKPGAEAGFFLGYQRLNPRVSGMEWQHSCGIIK